MILCLFGSGRGRVCSEREMEPQQPWHIIIAQVNYDQLDFINFSSRVDYSMYIHLKWGSDLEMAYEFKEDRLAFLKKLFSQWQWN